MNRAQAMLLADDLMDTNPRSAFVQELRRYYHALAHPLPERHRISRDEVEAFAKGAVEVLKACKPQRLNFREICERLGVVVEDYGADGTSRTMRNVLERLHEEGLLHRRGDYRRVYWVE